MANSKKLVMGDMYKDALIQKGTDAFRQEARALAKKTATNERIAEAKKKVLTTKRQRAIDQKTREVKWYKNKLERVEKRKKDGTYDILGRVTLGGFVLAIFAGILVHLHDSNSNLAFVLVIVAFLSLMVSVVIQGACLELESQIKDYSSKLKTARKELFELAATPPQD